MSKLIEANREVLEMIEAEVDEIIGELDYDTSNYSYILIRDFKIKLTAMLGKE